MPRALTYAASGVDIDRATRAKTGIKRLARSTFGPGVLSQIGSFGGLFRMPRLKAPVLVASVDGVGTKIKVAIAAGIHDTVGYDLVAHCINDILVQGARPLFFLDYLAMGRLEEKVVTQVVAGVAQACRENACALIGGETAEMPDLYQRGDYDLAGCIVGAAEKSELLDGSRIRKGHLVYGLESWGLHTNGYSLARAICFGRLRLKPASYVPELGATVANVLLQKHRCYFDDLFPLVQKRLLSGMAHITGGGLTDNLPRILPPRLSARIELGSWTPLPVFRFLQRHGRVPEADMYRTFNMGIGMAVVVPPRHAAAAEAHWGRRRTRFYRIGRIVPSGRSRVSYVRA